MPLIWSAVHLLVERGVPWLNLVSQFATVLSVTLSGVLFGSYPDGVVERPWQRRVLAALWAQLALPPLLLLTLLSEWFPPFAMKGSWNRRFQT